MSYTANRYNYGTPLSGVVGLTNESSVVDDIKYFTLLDNALDGTYYPIDGDVGLWDSIASDANGSLSSPYIVTISENKTLNAVRLTGSVYCYPVDFTIAFYNGDTLLHTITETGNADVSYTGALPEAITITRYVISISKVSAPNAVARLYNVSNPWYISSKDTVRVIDTASSSAESVVALYFVDSAAVKTIGDSEVTNVATYSKDTVKVSIDAERSKLSNVHAIMKASSRRIYGKVYITYTDPLLASEVSVVTSGTAYNSDANQVLDGNNQVDGKFFSLYHNDLSGQYVVSDSNSQVGWVSSKVSGANGYFDTAPYVRINFSSRPIVSLPIVFDTSHGAVVENFMVECQKEDGTAVTKTFVGNTLSTVIIDDAIPDVVAVTVLITKMSKEGYPAVIVDIPVVSTILYSGYDDKSELMSIDTLEELTYDDDIEALGGMSANETTIVLDNSRKDFYFNNKQSVISGSLKRNRKIVPWLGVEIKPGEIEWYQQGVYWAYSWKVPIGSLTATVVGFDTIGLLDTTSFTRHHAQINKSLGYLIEYVLNDAKAQLDFIEYKIDSALYDIIIPYAWFAAASHSAALRKICQSYPMHIYCDRQGVICAAPQKLHLDYYYDTWSDSTNVISKEYSSLHTTLPNIVNITVVNPQLTLDDNLVKDTLVFDITQIPERTLNFSKPYVSDIEIIVDKDAGVSYTYELFSWGVTFKFAGFGSVRSIECKGYAVDISNTSTITRRNEDSIRLNGAITRDISSDFIQTSSMGATIMDRLFSLSELDKYDVTVKYRGDIALSINDPILLKDGIAPTDKYNIRRHQLTWNGSLTGTADLNT